LPLVLLCRRCCRRICDWRLAGTLGLASTAAASSLALRLLLSSNWCILLLLLLLLLQLPLLLQSLHHPMQQRLAIAPRRCRLV
jgi:hypothetical protein